VPPVIKKIRELSSEMMTVCKKPEFMPYTSKSPCNGDEISLEHISDNSKIDETQKANMLALFKILDDLDNKADTQRSYGSMFFKKYYEWKVTQLKPKIDENRINLVLGKITFGEYNLKRKEFNNEDKLATKKFNEEVLAFTREPAAQK
jgi:hypothetical protein